MFMFCDSVTISKFQGNKNTIAVESLNTFDLWMNEWFLHLLEEQPNSFHLKKEKLELNIYLQKKKNNNMELGIKKYWSGT